VPTRRERPTAQQTAGRTARVARGRASLTRQVHLRKEHPVRLPAFVLAATSLTLAAVAGCSDRAPRAAAPPPPTVTVAEVAYR